MSLADLLWLPPALVAIAVVLGACGAQDAREATRQVLRSLGMLTAGVLAVGLVIHLIARLFA